MENFAVITALYHSGSFRNHLLGFRKNKMKFTSQGRSVLGKTVPYVLCTARGSRPRAVSKTSGTVFPNTDRPWLVNNIYIYIAGYLYSIRALFVLHFAQLDDDDDDDNNYLKNKMKVQWCQPTYSSNCDYDRLLIYHMGKLRNLSIAIGLA